uniref:arylamine N-acetyltransferase n=1 Tax=Arion vulgaris TaxID=1028688 RepID=A0A0B7AE92_9EUPU
MDTFPMDLLSKEEILRFIRDVLEIPITELPVLSGPSVSASVKVSFLESVIRAHLEKQPFQSISLMVDDVKNRHRPSWEEIKSNMFLSRGGLCYWHNTFMYVLLSSLGYDVVMSHSTVPGMDPNNHLVLIVRDLVTPGDLHLVDVGIGYYIPRPIPIDFVEESPVYKDSIMTYKFKRENDTTMILLKAAAPDRESSSLSQNIQETKLEQNGHKREEFKWEPFFYFDPTERSQNFSDFYSCFDSFFTDVTKLPCHTSPRAMRWSNDRFIGIVNSKLLEEKEEGKLTKTILINQDASAPLIKEDNDDDKSSMTDVDPVLQAYAKYFPQFPSDMVQTALKHWRAFENIPPLPSTLDY